MRSGEWLMCHEAFSRAALPPARVSLFDWQHSSCFSVSGVATALLASALALRGTPDGEDSCTSVGPTAARLGCYML